MEKSLKTFVLHDESVNTYGFRMLTGGCDLSVFADNPVMFYNHEDWTLPIGRWENIRVEGDRILAEAVFDDGDSRARAIARKVEGGFLKAASIGAWSVEASDDAALKLDGQTGATVTRWIAREASIVPIGANHHTVALYDMDNGKRLALSDMCRKHSLNLNETTDLKEYKMDLKVLRKLFNLADTASEEAVGEAAEKALQRNAELEQENARLRDEMSENALRQAEKQKEEAAALVDSAIKAGRIAAQSREAWMGVFLASFGDAKTLLGSIPEGQSIASLIDRGSGSASSLYAKMTWDELDKADRLADLKGRDAGLYAEKYFEKFGVQPSGAEN